MQVSETRNLQTLEASVVVVPHTSYLIRYPVTSAICRSRQIQDMSIKAGKGAVGYNLSALGSNP